MCGAQLSQGLNGKLSDMITETRSTNIYTVSSYCSEQMLKNKVFSWSTKCCKCRDESESSTDQNAKAAKQLQFSRKLNTQLQI